MEARTLAHGRRGDCGFDRCSILAAVMAMVAKLVPRSRVVGLDLWTDDQSGNRPEATLRNLEAEGVSDRCELKTGDMLSIPFPDDRFDLIVSSMAIHKIDENKTSWTTRVGSRRWMKSCMCSGLVAGWLWPISGLEPTQITFTSMG